MLYKATKTTVTTYYLDDVISLNDLRPIVLRALKDWKGKRITDHLATVILEDIMDGCYTYINKEEANVSGEQEPEMDRLVRSGD